MHKLTLIGLILVVVAIVLGFVSAFQLAGTVFQHVHTVTIQPGMTQEFQVSPGYVLILIYNTSTPIAYKVVNGTPNVTTQQVGLETEVTFMGITSSFTVEVTNPNNYPVNVTVTIQSLGQLSSYMIVFSVGVIILLSGIALIVVGVILRRRKR